jgi:hypothetical protein
MSNLIGAQLGDYRIDHMLGQGGMGTVYGGYNVHTGRQVAIKLIRGVQRDGAEALLKEARLLDQLDHPNIVRLLHCGVDTVSGHLYLVLELIGGGTLGDLIRQRAQAGAQVDLTLALALAQQAAAGLAHAHQFLVHHDIKPDNMLLRPRSAPGAGESNVKLKINDFGLARINRQLTQRLGQGGFAGTLEYAAPEEFSGQPGDARADIYSFGVVLYELLTGALPFQFAVGDMPAARTAHLHNLPSPPSSYRAGLAPWLDQLVLRCMAKRPADRWQSADELLAALGAASAGASVTTPVPPTVRLAPQAAGTSAGQATIVAVQATGDAPWLEVLDRNGATQRFQLTARLLVGRDPACDVVLPSERVSRRHAQIEWDGAQVLVTDLASSNGTELGGQHLRPHSAQAWPLDTELHIKPYRLRLKHEAGASRQRGRGNAQAADRTPTGTEDEWQAKQMVGER